MSSFKTVVLENDFLRLTMLPDIGCKIVSIYDKVNGYEWLWSDPHRPVTTPIFGDAYDHYDISGFDECFPNIGVSLHPLDSDLLLHDHGEIWARPWKVEQSENKVIAEISGEQMNFGFRRTITLVGRKVNFDYQVTNSGDENLVYLWSAHPLFKVTGEMVISCSTNHPMTKEFGFSERMSPNGSDGGEGRFNSYTWPTVTNGDGQEFDISQISLAHPLTDKVTLEIAKGAEFELRDKETSRAMTLTIPQGNISHIGICFNLGAWPFGEHPASWVALEPTNGCTDRLDYSYEKGAFRDLPATKSEGWNYHMEFN